MMGRFSNRQISIQIRSLLSRLRVHHKPRARGGETREESTFGIPTMAVSAPCEGLGHGLEDRRQVHTRKTSLRPPQTHLHVTTSYTNKNLKYF